MVHERPAILGESLFENPLRDPDGTIGSAFGVITELEEAGDTYGEVRIREAVWGGQDVIPAEASDIADAIVIVDTMIAKSPPKSAQSLKTYHNELLESYDGLGGSSVLLYFSHFIAGSLSRYRSEPEHKVDFLVLSAYENLGRLTGLHVPLSKEQEREKIESDVLPSMLDSFGPLYDALGTFYALIKELPPTITRRDKAVDDKLTHLLEAYSEHTDVYTVPEFAEWLKKGSAKLPRYNKVYYEIKDLKANGKRVDWEDQLVLAVASTPIFSYFKAEKGDLIFDFDKLREFIKYCQSKAVASTPEQGMSPYRTTAFLAATLVYGAQSDHFKSNKLATEEILATRIAQTRRLGLQPTADSLVYAFSFIEDMAA